LVLGPSNFFRTLLWKILRSCSSCTRDTEFHPPICNNRQN